MSESRYREVISGEARGPVARLIRCGVRGLAIGYRLAVGARNRCYDAGWKATYAASVPVVSVGNITAGGTGKTPLVAWVADWFVQRNIRVTLLSRGYRPIAGHVNDEKLVLDRLLPGVPHIQQPDRVEAAQKAIANERAELIVLDDGFQNRRLARDLDLVLIDALNPWGYGRLLPAGLLREPISSLSRADIVIITRADQVPATRRDEIAGVIRKYHALSDPVSVAFQPQCFIDLAGNRTSLESQRGQRVGLFCGIGNPAAFRQTVASLGVEIAWEQSFPDHHHYTDNDMRKLMEQAQRTNVAAVLTTEKDLVKWVPHPAAMPPVLSVRISAQVLTGGEVLEAACERILEKLHVQQTPGCSITRNRP